jgi:hypothetical protein
MKKVSRGAAIRSGGRAIEVSGVNRACGDGVNGSGGRVIEVGGVNRGCGESVNGCSGSVIDMEGCQSWLRRKRERMQRKRD